MENEGGTLMDKAKFVLDPSSDYAKLPYPDDMIEKVRQLE